MTTTQLLENFRKAQLQCALIVDEYGDIEGFVTLTDVLTAIVGEVPSSRGNDDLGIVRREDVAPGWSAAAWPSSGSGCCSPCAGNCPASGRAPTSSGWGSFIHMLGRIPRRPTISEGRGFRFEVVDMDNTRVDKILISPVAPAADPATTP